MKKNKKKEKIIKKEIGEFKEFINRGNVIEMSIGVLMGTSFSKIVTSIVNDVLMPTIGIFMGGLDFTNIVFKIKNAEIKVGSFIQSVVDFLIVAICIFVFIKILSKITKKKVEKEETKQEIKKKDEVLLLEEIRDLLKNKDDLN